MQAADNSIETYLGKPSSQNGNKEDSCADNKFKEGETKSLCIATLQKRHAEISEHFIKKAANLFSCEISWNFWQCSHSFQYLLYPNGKTRYPMLFNLTVNS